MFVCVPVIGHVGSFGYGVVYWLVFGLVVDVISVSLARDQLLIQFRDRAAVYAEEGPGLFGQLHRAVQTMAPPKA